MQRRSSGPGLRSGSGLIAANRLWAFHSFLAHAGRRMSLVDDIRARVFCQSALPERTGPLAVGTARLKLNGQAPGKGQAQRAIVVQFWYPVDEDQAAVHTRGLSWLARRLHPTWAPAHHGAPLTLAKPTFPFIVYLPDAEGRHDDNTFTLANLASHGFIVAAIDDPYRNGKLGIDTMAADASRYPNDAADPVGAHYASRVARGVAMASALLDGLATRTRGGPAGAWAERLDLKQVGILGYAMGGNAAAQAVVTDRRFSVAANLSGGVSGQAPVRVPYLLMLSDTSAAAQPAPELDAWPSSSFVEEYRRAQDQAALPESHVIEVSGTKREHFSDKLVFPSRLFPGCHQPPGFKRIRAIIDSYTVAFFTTYLRTDPHPLMCVRHSPYPEVHFITGSDETGAWALRAPAGRG